MPEQENGQDFIPDFDSVDNEALHIPQEGSDPLLETFEGGSNRRRSSEIDLSSPPSYPSYWGEGCWGIPNVERDLF